MQQLTLFDTQQVSEDFTSDDYETPDHIAKAIATNQLIENNAG